MQHVRQIFTYLDSAIVVIQTHFHWDTRLSENVILGVQHTKNRFLRTNEPHFPFNVQVVCWLTLLNRSLNINHAWLLWYVTFRTFLNKSCIFLWVTH